MEIDTIEEKIIVQEDSIGSQPELKKTKLLLSIASLCLISITVILLWLYVPSFRVHFVDVPVAFYYFLAAGFVFALIDGAIGMSYGVTSTTFSLSMGIPPASASTAVHLSEILSNGIAGVMHYKMGNVNMRLFKLLVIPGIIGAMIGAFLLSSLEHYNHFIKPLISIYTLILGLVILLKAFNLKRPKGATKKKFTNIGTLGFGGGLVDAIGGGGWGSIVLSTLIAGGRHARFSLGAVKASRFFVAVMSSLTFVTMLKGLHWEAIGGLVIGSAIASPIAARVANRISAKSIMVAVGVIVVLASFKSIISSIFT